jgi:Ala-tRNA(Pro) deacylase
LTATRADLFALLDRLDVAYTTVAHPRFYTVEEGLPWHDRIPGMHCKNLFLKNKKGQIWLVVLPCAKRADLGALERLLGSGRLSFGKPALLAEVLGIEPGSVTPFAVMNDTARRVTVVLDSAMMQADRVNYHPLLNDASTTLTPAGLMRFLTHLGYAPILVDCGVWLDEKERASA